MKERTNLETLRDLAKLPMRERRRHLKRAAERFNKEFPNYYSEPIGVKQVKQPKSAAIVTIKDAAKMSKQGRRSVAAWLIRQAYFLRRDGDKLASRFTARYLYK